MLSNPKPVLEAEEIYFGDNGRTFHGRCAGATASLTGRDLSGQRVIRATPADRIEFAQMVGKPLACESCGGR